MTFSLIIGDLVHAVAVISLFLNILYKKSYNGISQKTQLLFCMVFATRYWNLYYGYGLDDHLVYVNMFILFVTLMTFLLGHYYEKIEEHDTFIGEYLIFFAMVITIWYGNDEFAAPDEKIQVEMFQLFSKCLEALAIIPQVYMVFKIKEITTTLIFYMFCQSLYQLLYFFDSLEGNFSRFEFDSFQNTSNTSFIIICVLSLLLMLCSGIKINNDINGTSKKYLFSEAMMPNTIFTISNIDKPQVESDRSLLPKENELLEKDNELMQIIEK